MQTYPSEQARLDSFAKALDALRVRVEREVDDRDIRKMQRIRQLSSRLELMGRGLIWVSFEPLSLCAGTAALCVHKILELMPIGHTVLHGTFDRHDQPQGLSSKGFRWKAPIDEAGWSNVHNLRHHQYTNIAGRDPDLDFGGLRLAEGVPHRAIHLLQPISNLLSWLGFALAINLHVTGVLDAYGGRSCPAILRDRKPATIRAARRAALRKLSRYYGRELLFFPALSGIFFPKTLAANLLSEVGRDVFAAATIYCGHLGAKEYPADTRARGRGAWYVLQVEGSCDIDVPEWVSVLCGGLDKQIEHHLFPRLPPHRLREIAPEVKAICEAHGVQHRSESWPRRFCEVMSALRALARAPSPGSA